MNKEEICYLKEQSRSVRKTMINNCEEGAVYHFGGVLSVIDILVYIYFHKLKDVNLLAEERDKVILSKGHACQCMYTIFQKLGYISLEELKGYKKFESRLQGHPDMKRLKCIDYSSGSLGQGLSVGVGMALGRRLQEKDLNVFVVLGDGELQEGEIWEAAMTASKYKLDNLVCYVDYNKFQVDGNINEVMPIEPLKQKWEAFGWYVCEVDGHDFQDIDNAQKKCDEVKGKPKIIIANTIKGKGISFMEGKKEWHSRALSYELREDAIKEVNSYGI